MTAEHSPEERRAFLAMLDNIGRIWIGIFENDYTFWNADYWDLFTGMWKEINDFNKNLFIRNEINAFVKVGPKKTADMVEKAIARGYLEAVEDPRDKRQRAVRMSDDFKRRIDAYLDRSVGEARARFTESS